MLPAIIAALVAGAGVTAGVHVHRRQPLPADLAAQVRGGLMAPDASVLLSIVNALTNSLGGKWKHQVTIVWKATQAAAGATPPPADIVALYNGGLKSGSSATMLTIANQLAHTGKYNHLVSQLRDVAKILSNLKA
jgi:hypothetical protein